MWTRAQLKRNAKIAYRRNYWLCILVSLIVTALGGIAYGWPGLDITITRDMEALKELGENYKAAFTASEWAMFKEVMMIGIIVGVIVGSLAGVGCILFLGNLATVGGSRFYLENREHKTSLLQVFYAFRDGRYKPCVKAMLVRWIIIKAYSILFIIPGIVKSYAYRLVPYILAENPMMDRKRALELSEDMMRGHKWEAFVFDLSFIGWKLAGMLSGGLLNVFVVEPYVSASYAEYYTALKSEAIYKGITSRTELPGVSEAEEVVEECL